MVITVGQEKVQTCPLYPILINPAGFNRLMRLYRYAEKGILPEPGGLEDQAAPLISALSFIGLGVDQVQSVLMERSRTGKKTADMGE